MCPLVFNCFLKLSPLLSEVGRVFLHGGESSCTDVVLFCKDFLHAHMLSYVSLSLLASTNFAVRACESVCLF